MASGSPVTVQLSSKGISFGWITMHSSGRQTSGGLRGIDKDLVVKPFQWKGAVATIRDFAVDASHNELGMDPSELVGLGVDADNDGVKDELSIGDVSALNLWSFLSGYAIAKANSGEPRDLEYFNAFGGWVRRRYKFVAHDWGKIIAFRNRG